MTSKVPLRDESNELVGIAGICIGLAAVTSVEVTVRKLRWMPLP